MTVVTNLLSLTVVEENLGTVTILPDIVQLTGLLKVGGQVQ